MNEQIATVRQTTLPPNVKATHEARSGQAYDLYSNKDCEMPLEDAYTFLIDKAFEVKGPGGEIIRPPSTKSAAGRIELDDDEVIANLEELTNDALLKRCKRYDGSGGIRINTRKDEKIAFLIEQSSKVEYGTARGSENAPPEMSESDLDTLVGPPEI